jgi:sugar transferase EpsL
VRLKRAFDFVVAALAMVFLSPIFAILAFAIRMNLGSPVLFRQERPGLRDRPFTLLKFRSMRDAYAPDGALLPDSERLSTFGRFLRRTSLDELPELVNVLRGEMSLVGPRPLLMEYLPRYLPRQARRHEVPPGITGLAQVSGRNALSWEERFELDVWYVEHRSFWLDLRILAKTVVRIISGRGVAQPGHATAEKFRGYDHRTGEHA